MIIWSLLAIAVLAETKNISQLDNIYFSGLKDENFDAVLISDCDKEDELLESSMELAKNYQSCQKSQAIAFLQFYRL